MFPQIVKKIGVAVLAAGGLVAALPAAASAQECDRGGYAVQSYAAPLYREPAYPGYAYREYGRDRDWRDHDRREPAFVARESQNHQGYDTRRFEARPRPYRRY
jgi:hypothetical protein